MMGVDKTKQRASTRTVVVSKAFKVVSDEARKEVRDKRLQMLEADNYVEEQELGGDDAYDEDVSNQTTLGSSPHSSSLLSSVQVTLTFISFHAF